MLILEGLKDFGRDLINVKLLILKITYFTLLAGVVILWPQFTIHQQALGLTQYQTGICGSVVSGLVIFLPVLSGVVGDKLGNFKLLMSATTALAGVPALLFAWVPTAKIIEPTSNGTMSNTTAATNTLLTETATLDVDPEQLKVTFWLYLSTRVAFGALQATGYTLFEASVMANMQDSGINFGYQRAWGTIGVIVSSYLGGYLIELTGGYSVIFYVSCGLQILTGVLMMGIRMDFKLPSTSLSRDILKYLFNAEVLIFFGAILSAGMFIGYLETFMYRYLFELGATPVLIGLTVTVGAPFELLFTLITSYFVNLFGHAPLIMMGLLAYTIRMVGFSLLVDPWWVLPLEILESVANGVLFTAAIMYCTVLFSMDTIASFRGAFAAIYFGVGKLLGTVIGTEIRELFGDRTTFQVWAVVALLCAAIYCLAYILMKRHRKRTFFMESSEIDGDTQEKHQRNMGIDNRAWDSCEQF